MFNFAFQMRWPGISHEQPHHQGSGYREASLVEESNGHESKDKWMRRAPKPKILVENVESDNN